MKYKLGEKHPELKLYRVVALKDFGFVKAGDVGGWVADENNLSQEGCCWVSGDALVSGDAHVYGDARVYGYAHVYGDARVSGSAHVYGDAQISGIRRTDGHTFCFVRDKDGGMRVIAGCRYFTMAEAREHWEQTRGGTPLGDETMAILDCLEAMSKVRPEGCV